MIEAPWHRAFVEQLWAAETRSPPPPVGERCSPGATPLHSYRSDPSAVSVALGVVMLARAGLILGPMDVGAEARQLAEHDAAR